MAGITLRGIGIAVAVAIAAILVSVIGAIVRVSLTMTSDQSFALIRNQTFLSQPSAYHARHRLAEYTDGDDRFFFQWWNYIVTDDTGADPFAIIVQVNHHSSEAQPPTPSFALVGVKHGSLSASLSVPLSSATLGHDMDVSFSDSATGGSVSQTVIDNDTYQITGILARANNNGMVKFSVTFHRIHGAYTGLDREADNRGASTCSVISNHFAYDSRVTGTWREIDSDDSERSYTFTRDTHHGYAAGSWGCQLPSAPGDKPAVNYPWTWAWLSVPATDTSPDIGICVGTARLDGTWLLGDLYGGYSLIGIGGERVVSTSFASAYSGTVMELPLIATSNDRHLTRYNVTLSQWSNYSDGLGTASLPLTQHYDIATASYHLSLTLSSSLSDYFRAPVIVEDPQSHLLKLFSDFRASNVRARFRLVDRVRNVSVYDGEAQMNAVEYAYRADLDTDLQGAIKLLSSTGP